MKTEALDPVFDELERRGMLLLVDSMLPSVAGLVAGAPVKGSWWGHPKGQEIFQTAEKLSDHPDVAVVKLVLGKVTFVHRKLWPVLLAVATSRESWQMQDLSSLAKALLAKTEEAGDLNVDQLQKSKPPESKVIGNAVRELESRMLVYSEQFHTESGSHAKRIESWSHWAPRVKVGRAKMDVAQAKAQIEKAVKDFGFPTSDAGWLPWNKIDKDRRERKMSKKAVLLLASAMLFGPNVVRALETKAGNDIIEIGHIHVGVQDLPSALNWFEKVLQWKPTYQDQRIGILSSKPIHVILDATKEDAPATIAFASEDVDADYKRLIARGAVSLEAPNDKPYGVRAAYLKGPGALKIEIEGPFSSAKSKSDPAKKN